MNSSLFNDLSKSFKVSVELKHKILKAIIFEKNKRNMTNKEFADFLKITKGTITKLERFDYNFSIEYLLKICTDLDLKVDVLIS